MSQNSVTSKRLCDENFKSLRKEVLGKWPTGKEVDLNEAIAYHKTMPAEKNLVGVIRKAKNGHTTLVYPRGGVALLDEQKKLMLYLQDQGGADYLPTTTDSYTRNERFRDTEIGIERSRINGRSMLNGFPVVNYGVQNCRSIIEEIKVPAQVLPGTPFVTIIGEIAFAAGYTGLLGSGISDTLRFTKELSLAQGIKNYQYIDRLVSYYQEKGVSLHREQTGFLTGTLIPPGIALAVAVLDCLLAVSQGVKNYSLGIGQNLNVVQDVATLRVAGEICCEYLDKFGFNDVSITTGSHQWMGAFPTDEAEAVSVICLGAMIGVLGNATYITTKTSHEAIGVPTPEANAAGLRATKKIIKLMRNLRFPLNQEVEIETNIIKKEVRSIVDKTLELGDGDPALGSIRGFEAGIIDIPWAPNIHVANKVMPARDYSGAVRYLDFGNLALTEEVKDFHRMKLQERASLENRQVDLQMAIEDVSEVAKSVLETAG
ncbi:MAG: methylaspartate mutase subunit E [Dehalobacterium sp.]